MRWLDALTADGAWQRAAALGCWLGLAACPDRPAAAPPPPRPARAAHLDASCGQGDACLVGRTVRFRALDVPEQGFLYVTVDAKPEPHVVAKALAVGPGVTTVPTAYLPSEADMKAGFTVRAWLVPQPLAEERWQEALASGTGPGALSVLSLELMP